MACGRFWLLAGADVAFPALAFAGDLLLLAPGPLLRSSAATSCLLCVRQAGHGDASLDRQTGTLSMVHARELLTLATRQRVNDWC